MNICESCGMPIEQGPYCRHCTTGDGNLQPFEERLGLMVDFAIAQDSSLARGQAEVRVRAHMRTMPAREDHPALKD